MSVGGQAGAVHDHDPPRHGSAVSGGRIYGASGIVLHYSSVCDYTSGVSIVEFENEGETNDIDLVTWSRDGVVTVPDLDVGETASTTVGYTEPGLRFGYYTTAPVIYPFSQLSPRAQTN